MTARIVASEMGRDLPSFTLMTSAARIVAWYATIHAIQASIAPARAARDSARRRRAISARASVSSSRSAPGNSLASARSVPRSATAPPLARSRLSAAITSYLRKSARSSSLEGSELGSTLLDERVDLGGEDEVVVREAAHRVGEDREVDPVVVDREVRMVRLDLGDLGDEVHITHR